MSHKIGNPDREETEYSVRVDSIFWDATRVTWLRTNNVSEEMPLNSGYQLL